MRVVNAYAIAPRDIQEGDVMMLVIKAIVVRLGIYRLYLCPYEGGGEPQGQRIFFQEAAVASTIFPSLSQVAKPDPF